MSFEFTQTVYGALPSNLTEEKLSKICENNGVQTGPFGSQLHKEDYVVNGTPIITVEHLGENRIIHENLPRVSNDDRERLKKYQIKAGDIVFSRVGSVDRRALVQVKEDGWLNFSPLFTYARIHHKSSGQFTDMAYELDVEKSTRYCRVCP